MLMVDFVAVGWNLVSCSPLYAMLRYEAAGGSLIFKTDR